MRQSLMLLGRSGSGKTSVMETLCGSEVKNARDVQSFTRFGLEIKAKETFGFFSGKHDLKTCVKDLEECVCSFPGIDIIGFVIRIARFTPEEREMIENVRVTLGERAFGFTIVIFTNLDNLIYDDVPLSEFLEDSPQELNDLLSLCDGRYVGFNNKGSEEDRQGYARSLIEAMKTLQKKNKSAKYTVDLLEQARNAKLVKDEEKKKVEEENFRLVKEQMKHEISTEVEAKVRKELQDKRSAQDFIARQFTEDNEKRQQDCGDHGRRKLEDIRFDQDQGIRKQDGIRYCGDQERRKTDCMWYGEDQGTRKPDDMWCREDQGRSKPDGRWFGGNQARRKPDGMRCGGNQARRKPDGMRCGEDQGKRNPDGIQYGVVQGRKPDVMRYVEDEAQRTLENRCWPEDQMRRKPEVKQSTEDNGKIELEDKRCDEDIDKPAGEEGAFKARNKKTKPRPKTKPKPNLLMEENKKLAGGEGALKAGNKKPKTKPKPDHLKEKNKKLAEFKDDSERTRPRNSMPRRIFETLTQAWRAVTRKN